MALKGLVGKLSEKIAGSLAGKPGRGPWQPAQGGYPRLMLMDADVLKDLQETGGVFALWHNGVRHNGLVSQARIVWVRRLRCSKQILILFCTTAMMVFLSPGRSAALRTDREWSLI